MPRPVKKKLKFTEESLNELVQECYNDTHTLRSEVTTLLNKWKRHAINEAEMVALGKEIVSLINQQDKVLEKKLSIVKVLKEVILSREKISVSEKDDKKVNDIEMSKINQLIEEIKSTNE